MSEIARLPASSRLHARHIDWAYNKENIEGYVSRMTGFFVPPIDGDYKFLIIADDVAELSLAEDHTTNKVKYMALKLTIGLYKLRVQNRWCISLYPQTK